MSEMLGFHTWLETGLHMIILYIKERTCMQLAASQALDPEKMERFMKEFNAEVEKMMRTLEWLIEQYKKNPPSKG